MRRSDRIFERFREAGVLRGSEYWFRAAEALKIIEEARQTGNPLLGFDGARIDEKWIRPSLADSWDYSGSSWPSVKDPYTHAVEFIGERSGTDLYFSIVLED